MCAYFPIPLQRNKLGAWRKVHPLGSFCERRKYKYRKNFSILWIMVILCKKCTPHFCFPWIPRNHASVQLHLPPIGMSREIAHFCGQEIISKEHLQWLTWEKYFSAQRTCTLILTYPKFCAPLGIPATNSGDKKRHLEGEPH